MKLDRKGIEAASNWFSANFNGLPDTGSLATGTITAYLTAIGETHMLVPKLCHVPLGNGGHTLISEEDVERVYSAGSWFSVRKASGLYACRNFNENNRIYLQRFILDAPPDMVVDHINGNTLDNRRENLRIVTHAENARNLAGATRRSKSGVRGIYSDKRSKGRWFATITHHKKRLHLGTFDTIEEAKRARAEAEERLWSETDRYRSMHAAAVKEGE